MTTYSLNHEIAMANASGYAWAAEDFTGTRTWSTPQDPAGAYAFALAYATSRDEYDAGRRGSHPSVSHAYATWQRTGPAAPSVHEPGTPPARPAAV
jgi:hypothetical protein